MPIVTQEVEPGDLDCSLPISGKAHMEDCVEQTQPLLHTRQGAPLVAGP